MGPIEIQAMRQAFNCGIGMIAVVPKEAVSSALLALNEVGESAWVCGEVFGGSAMAKVVWNDG
jgi:phosphoribosylformylglycinamidine cyclo-ligase